MDLLITGADGFIGTALCRRLHGRIPILALSRRPHIDTSGIRWIRADLQSPDFVASLPPRVDAVVALAQSRRYRDFPDAAPEMFDVNLRSLHQLLDWARAAGVSRFLYASSANVYARSDEPITEQGEIAPATFYARTKRMAEMLVDSYAGCFDVTTLRLFTVYGPGQQGTLIPSLVERIRDGRDVELQGEHGLRLSPTAVDDVARIIESLLLRRRTSRDIELFNLGGPEPLTVRDLAVTIADALGLTPSFAQVEGPEPRGWVADTSRLAAALGPLALRPFATGVHDILHHAHEQLPAS